MPKIAPFEQYADLYDDWFAEHSEMYEGELEAVRQLLPEKKGDWLEVGVGTGKFAVPFGVDYGLEPSPVMAERAEKAGIKVYAGVAEALPFEDERFEMVLMVTTVCFVDDLLLSLKEAFRVLKKNGSLLVGFVDKNSVLGRLYLKNRHKSKFYKDAVFYSASDIVKNIEYAGGRFADSRQVIIPNLSLSEVKSGYGEGSFVVIKGVKQIV
jgi:ubiquinone/menaquinone biosynthesis C-methylase UbiE